MSRSQHPVNDAFPPTGIQWDKNIELRPDEVQNDGSATAPMKIPCDDAPPPESLNTEGGTQTGTDKNLHVGAILIASGSE